MSYNSSASSVGGIDESAQDEGIDLGNYWRVFLRYKWAILGLVFAVGFITTVWSYSLQPVYRSTATLLIGGNETVTVSSNSSSQSWVDTGKFFGTQYELLKSRKVARMVLEKLETDRAVILGHVEADSQSGFGWRNWIPRSWLGVADSVDPRVAESDPDKALLNWLRHGLEVVPVRETSLVQVSFEAPEPKLAARITNAYTGAYLDYNLRQRIESTTEASQWLEGQLAKAEEQVMKSAETLRQFREDAGLADVAGMQNVQTGLLKDRAASLSAARLASSEAEGLYLRAVRLQKEGQMDNIPEVLENGRIQRLRDEEELLEREIRSDSERYQGDYPELDDSRNNLRATRKQINEALNKIVEGFKTDFEIARDNEMRLETHVRALEGDIQMLGHKQVEARALERTVETNRLAYDALLNQLMETRTRSADTVSMIARILDPAEAVFTPVKPNKPLLLMISLILALMVGVGIALMRDKLDNTLKSSEDVQDRLGVPVLGELMMLKGKRDDGALFAPHTQFLDEPTSSFAESIRTIRTGVVLSSLDQSHQTLVVTSTVNGEGKSTVAFNLALALGQLGKVLLIDADLRNSTLATLFGLDPGTPGLTDLVSGAVTVEECIRKNPEDVDVLFAGSTVPPDPLKILSSERFSKLLEKAAADYDMVVIDSAPVQLVSDARVLATRATGVVYVAKADATAYQVVRYGLDALIDTGTPLLGVVLNQINPDTAHAYGKFRHGYSRYGGYGHYSYGHDPRSAESPVNIHKAG